MVLRYFYIDEYNETARNLDVNLGGKYKFHYERKENILQAEEDEKYVENLYSEFDVISDISAILGKNSAGKTTILRMINSVFNGFDIYNRKSYIIIFEKEHNYILYSNCKGIKCNKPINKKIQYNIQKCFKAVDVLKNVGLIYFSNIFDKSTPFWGNANLIDISMNFTFENFYEENSKKKVRKNGERAKIMDEYKSDCILQELDFMLAIENADDSGKINLLFEIPTQIKLGFGQILPENEEEPFCGSEDDNRLLKAMNKSLCDYFIEEEHENSVSFFRDKIISFFIFDELCRLCKEDNCNMQNALGYWINKMQNYDWEISEYYHTILEQVEGVYIAVEDSQENFDEMEEEREKDYADIWEDVEWICDSLSELADVNYNAILYKITRIRNAVERGQKTSYRLICYYLEEAVYLIEELQNDLMHHDYDLYNITYTYEICDLIESVYALLDSDLEYWAVEVYDQSLDIEIDEEEMKVRLDSDTENHLMLLEKVIEVFMDFTKRYEYDIDTDMLAVKLDNEDILEFIYNFRELGCETVVLDIRRTDISSGHSAYLDMCARINSARKSGEIQQKENVILLIDEGDIYLHPEKQLAYLNNLLKLLQLLYQGKKVQLIVTSNSPFVISDIQTSNILYLENIDGMVSVAKSSISNTFAANVNNLLLDSFFVENGLIGEYAFEKINSVIQDIGGGRLQGEAYQYIKNIIEIIGEPFIKRKLENMLFRNMGYDDLQKEIQYYEDKLKRMKKFNRR